MNEQLTMEQILNVALAMKQIGNNVEENEKFILIS